MKYKVVKAWAHRTNGRDVIMRYETYFGDPVIRVKKPTSSYEDCDIVRVEIKVPMRKGKK